MALRVNTIVQTNDRRLMVKIKAEPVDVDVIQVYMPTSDHDEEEKDKCMMKLKNCWTN